jgi:hypothetical protein
MLNTWLLIVWIGTTSNFQILHETWSQELCERELAVWSIILNNVVNQNLECVQDLREGRSQYPPRPGSFPGLAK